VTTDPPRILRYGAIAPEQFEALGFIVEAPLDAADGSTIVSEATPAPGMMLKHYSPRARLRFYGDDSALDAMIRQMRADAQELAARGQRVGILSTDTEAPYLSDLPAQVVTLGIGLPQIAARLFAAMRELDQQGVDVILAHSYGRTGIGAALYERLLRAAEGQIVRLSESKGRGVASQP
jgi:L-threonylcarbamoyladenylate synthase